MLYLIMLLSLAVPTFSYYSDFVSYFSVGSDPAEFTVGQDYALLTVGIGETPVTPTATSPIEDYIAAKPILLLVPGLLLLAFVIWFWFLGFRNIRQSQLISGLAYITISFILIGISLTVAIPIIINGVESTIWFK